MSGCLVAFVERLTRLFAQCFIYLLVSIFPHRHCSMFVVYAIVVVVVQQEIWCDRIDFEIDFDFTNLCATLHRTVCFIDK